MAKRNNAKKFLESVNGDICTVCEVYYYDFLKNNEKVQENFRLLLNWDLNSTKTNKLENIRGFEEYKIVLEKIRPIIQTGIDNLISKELIEKEFYEKLWDFINEETLFGSDIDRICAIVCMLVSSKIPYYYIVEGMKMDEDEYAKLSDCVNEKLRKAFFVINVGLTQKTEVASQILKILDSIDNEKERVVLFANIIGAFENKINILSKELKNCKEQKK